MNRKEFTNELGFLGIEYDEKKLDQLQKYYELLINWNKKINLTAITEEKDVYLKHFYDSLTLVKVIDLKKENSFCDIGTGAGFPGIVIKIFFPHLKVTLVDALNKRVNFLNIVVSELGLSDIEIIHARAEEYALTHRNKFDVVTARAVASINILLEFCMPMIKVNKYFIAMKGKNEEISINALKLLNSEVINRKTFLLLDAGTRTLIKVRKKGNISDKYPRKFSDIKKKTL